MADLDALIRGNHEYSALLDRMLAEDQARMEFSKKMAETMKSLSRRIYSSMKWPVKLVHPMFEARAAYAVPNNYFQNLLLDGEKLGNAFGHGAMRSLFFAGGKLILFSKGVNFHDGKEYFTSFLLLHLEPDEYKKVVFKREIKITANIEKPLKNMITGKVEKKRIGFTFIHQPVSGRIVSRDRAMRSARFKSVYDRHKGGAQAKAASMDLEGYAVTVPHFSPHPFLFRFCKELGYEDNRDFQEHAADYFLEHLGAT